MQTASPRTAAPPDRAARNPSLPARTPVPKEPVAAEYCYLFQKADL